MARYQTLTGVDAVLQGLGGLRGQLRDGLRGLVRSATTQTEAHARTTAPVGRLRGGTTRAAIRHTYFDDGDTGAVFVAPMKDARGRRRAKNLPVWLEYGTRKMDPRPFLVPAGREAGRRMAQDALTLVTQAVKRAES
jgi:hypothetical protein